MRADQGDHPAQASLALRQTSVTARAECAFLLGIICGGSRNENVILADMYY